MEFECNICNKQFSSEESLNQHNKAKHGSEERGKGKKKNVNIKRYVLLSFLVLAILIISATFYVKGKQPGQYDEFAKCLSEKNAIIYGNDFCQYTGKQLNWFGKSEKYLGYIKCANNKELCDSKGIKTTPTWEINGKMYEGVQSFEKLAELSGCKI